MHIFILLGKLYPTFHWLFDPASNPTSFGECEHVRCIEYKRILQMVKQWSTNTPVAGWRFDGIAMFASSVSCKETTGGWYHRSSSTRCFAILSRRIVSRICLGWFTSTVSHALWKILLMSKTCPAAFSKYSFWPKFIAQPSKRVFLYTLIQDLWWT